MSGFRGIANSFPVEEQPEIPGGNEPGDHAEHSPSWKALREGAERGHAAAKAAARGSAGLFRGRWRRGAAVIPDEASLGPNPDSFSATFIPNLR